MPFWLIDRAGVASGWRVPTMINDGRDTGEYLLAFAAVGAIPSGRRGLKIAAVERAC